MSDTVAIGLPALEKRLHRELELIGHDRVEWTRPHMHEDLRVLDVAIVGVRRVTMRA